MVTRKSSVGGGSRVRETRVRSRWNTSMLFIGGEVPSIALPLPGYKLYSRFYADAPASWLPLSVFTVKTTAAPRNRVALAVLVPFATRERERERERKGPGSRAFCFLPAMLNKPIWRSRSSARNGERQLATFLVFKNTYRSPRRVSFFLDERTFPYYYI